MGKSFRSGHSFPTSAGFSGSSGKVASVKPYTRSAPKPRAKGALLSTAPKGQFASAAVPRVGTPPRKPKLAAPPMPIGSAVQGPRTRKITQSNLEGGGSQSLLPGYKKGGLAKC